jgi:hypothetical protein
MTLPDPSADRRLWFRCQFCGLVCSSSGGIYTEAADVGRIWSERLKPAFRKTILVTRP